MNWDITIGQCKQSYGRYMQRIGSRMGNRKLVMDGERAEYSGRLQMRYGTLKYQALWNLSPSPIHGNDGRQHNLGSVDKSMSL